MTRAGLPPAAPSGGAAPEAAELPGGERLGLAAPAWEIARRHRAEFPDEQERYGDRGLAWCAYDNQWILSWAAADAAGFEDLARRLEWLAGSSRRAATRSSDWRATWRSPPTWSSRCGRYWSPVRTRFAARAPSRGRASQQRRPAREQHADPREHREHRQPRREEVGVLEADVLGGDVLDRRRQPVERPVDADVGRQREQRRLDHEAQQQDDHDRHGLVAHQRPEAHAEAAEQRRHEHVAPDLREPLAQLRRRQVAGAEDRVAGDRRSRSRSAATAGRPAAANASVLAARNFSRSGAASSELVIVRWRHSPVMPTIARIVMNRLLVSAVNTSVSTESSSRLGEQADERHDQHRGAPRRRRRARRTCAWCAA